MALHTDRGKEGESMAGDYLKKRGFDVHHNNWRSGHYEIDIIASRDGIVHFVEVKTRHSLEYGYPEENVSKRKFNNMIQAATAFLSRYPSCLKIQYDVLAILRLPGKEPEFLLLEDVWMW